MVNMKKCNLSIVDYLDNDNLEYDGMFDDIIAWTNITDSYEKTQKGGPRLKYSAMLFKEHYVSNLKTLKKDILKNEYKHGGYIKFLVKDPKERIIYAPTYRDKIVQHMINNILRDFYEPKFIFDSYACIRDKGTHRAVKRIQHFQNSSKEVYENPYFLKLDVSKFFYTIDRDILKTILRNKITCKRTLALIDKILDSFPSPLGLPLGNLTSQLFANIYLNEIDHIIKRKYKIRYYVRYADDMFLIVDGIEKANELKDLIINDIHNILKLTINPKKINITPSNRIHGLGFTITPTKIYPLSRNKRKLRKMLRTKDIDSLNSWYGYAHISQCYNIINRSIKNTEFVFIDGKFGYKNHDNLILV